MVRVDSAQFTDQRAPGHEPGAYALFSDESRHTEGQFRSIAAVSLPARRVVELNDELTIALESSKKGELKWRRIGRSGKKNVGRAIAAVDFLLAHIAHGVHARVLTWDTKDSRHSVENRDDIDNFARMSYQLYRSVMARRATGATWHIRRDRNGTDGQTIRDCLNSDGAWSDHSQLELSAEFRRHPPVIGTWEEVDSAATPLVQLADLMAGMTAYARTKAATMHALLRNTSGQGRLLPATVNGPSPTETDRGRFQVIAHLYEGCKKRRLGVSFRTKGYLRTPGPDGPVNFWHYEPQGPWDTAPVRDPIPFT